jgi:hypothetical protein
MLDVLEPAGCRFAHDEPPSDERWPVAGAEFRRRIDDDIRRRSPGGVLPGERQVRVGQVNFWRVHAYALDRLDELLEHVLPAHELINGDTTWRGRANAHGNWTEVSLLSGEWFDPKAHKRGNDLVGLIAHVFRMSRRRAAIRLAAELGIEAVRHV